jgi:UDP-N-acetyl-2-amino-2-deoxyglucuronate dehydrogenase
MSHFALIGAAGYIAPRHMKAIKETGNTLVAAYDPNDSVGIIDSYFPEADFFTEFERFDRHVEKLRRSGHPVDYVSICSPNYLHDAHIRFALRNGAHAICEKPIVLNPWNVDALAEIEAETDRRVYTILQLRLHPAIKALKEKYSDYSGDPIDVDLTYITSRGSWYHHSWKGDVSKSGGIATNIGVHFFDMLAWVFQKEEGRKKKEERRKKKEEGRRSGEGVKKDEGRGLDIRIDRADMPTTIDNARGFELSVNHLDRDMASGVLRLPKANVRWMLSINADHLPAEQKEKGQRTFRSIKVEGTEIEFSDGFTDLHTLSYQEILKGEGFGLLDARQSIEIVHLIREVK